MTNGSWSRAAAAAGASALCGWLLVALTACQMMVEEPAPPVERTVSFSQEIQPIFEARCGTCHRDGGIAAFEGIAIRLDAESSYDSLVNQPSVQNSDFTLVVPGDSASSLLFLKVSEDSPPVGSRMPLTGAPLSAAQLGLIRDWIDQGALDN